MLVYNKNIMCESKRFSSISLTSAAERTTSIFKSSAATAATSKSQPPQKSQKLQPHRKHCRPLLRPENKLFLKANGHHPLRKHPQPQ